MPPPTAPPPRPAPAPPLTPPLEWAYRVLVLALLAGFGVSLPLWYDAPRLLPVVPAFGFLSPVGLPASVALLSACALAALASLHPRARPAAGGAVLATLALLVALDMNRVQPWVYQYALMFGLYWLHARGRLRESQLRLALQLIFIGMYFWTGVFKVNRNYFQLVAPWFVEPVFHRSQHAVARAMIYASPLIEAGIAALLLFCKRKHAGFLLALGLHAVVLRMLGPWGHDYNHVVYPWNVAMPLFVGFVFVPDRDRSVASALRTTPRHAAVFAIAVVCCVLPPLNRVDAWPDMLSFKLYYDVSPTITVRLTREAYELAPARVRREFGEVEPGVFAADLDMVSMAEARAPLSRGVWHFRREARAIVRRHGCGRVLGFDIQTTRDLFTGALAHEHIACDSLRE